MAGYAEDYSKSNNALDAESNGIYPASTVAKILKVPTEVVREAGASEWHHTSGWYNKTEYFDLEYVREWLETDRGRRAVAASKAHKSIEVHNDCRVTWLEWWGTRNHPKCQEMRAEGCKVTISGKTAVVELPDGSVMKKRLSTNGFSVEALAAD